MKNKNKMFPKKRHIKRVRKRNTIFNKNKRRITRKNSIRKQNKNLKSKLLKYLIATIIILVFYLIFFSNIFSIERIENLNSTVETQALSNKIKSELRNEVGENLFLLDSKKIAEKIIEQFPEIEKIEIRKKFPKTLAFQFEEFPLIANLIVKSTNLEKTYILNSLGFIIKENSENKALPYIKMQTNESLNPNKKAIEKTKLEYILSAKQYFEEKFGMKIKETIYKPIPRELHLLTERDFYIWLDTEQSFEEQFQKLKKASPKLDIYAENIEYIDLRISVINGSKIIVK